MDIVGTIDGQRGFISVLLLLKEREKANIKEITAFAQISNTAAYNVIPILLDLKLIHEKEETHERSRGRKRKNYYLTEKGTRVAEIVGNMVQEIIE